MDIVQRKVSLNQAEFSENVLDSIQNYISSNSNRSYHRFPSLYEKQLIDIDPSYTLSPNTMTSNVYQDVISQKVEKWLIDHQYQSAERSLKSCGTTGITATCTNNHNHALGISCSKPYCVTCSMKKSYIHSRKVSRLEDRLLEPVNNGLTATYAVVTFSRALQNWVLWSNTDFKVQKQRLKDLRKIVNKTPIEFYKSVKGDSNIEDASVSTYHMCGSEYISTTQYIKEINRRMKSKAFFEGYKVGKKFNKKDLDEMVTNKKVEYMEEEYTDTLSGEIKHRFMILSPTNDQFHLHLNLFLLHNSKGDAFIPKGKLNLLRQQIKNEIQLYLEKESNKGEIVPDNLLDGDFNVNYHVEYFDYVRTTELKHRISYALRETIGASRFSRMSNRNKHYILNVLKGFHTVSYYGRLSTRNINSYLEELGITLIQNEGCVCTVCDSKLSVNMQYNNQKKRMYGERIGSGIKKETEVIKISSDGNTSIRLTEVVTEVEDEGLGYDEQLYPQVERLMPLLDDAGNVIGYKFISSCWRLSYKHLQEKYVNDVYKLLHLSVLKKDFRCLSRVVSSHIEVLNNITSINNEERLVA